MQYAKRYLLSGFAPENAQSPHAAVEVVMVLTVKHQPGLKLVFRCEHTLSDASGSQLFNALLKSTG